MNNKRCSHYSAGHWSVLLRDCVAQHFVNSFFIIITAPSFSSKPSFSQPRSLDFFCFSPWSQWSGNEWIAVMFSCLPGKPQHPIWGRKLGDNDKPDHSMLETNPHIFIIIHYIILIVSGHSLYLFDLRLAVLTPRVGVCIFTSCEFPCCAVWHLWGLG